MTPASLASALRACAAGLRPLEAGLGCQPPPARTWAATARIVPAVRRHSR